jgi:hypothetical protein
VSSYRENTWLTIRTKRKSRCVRCRRPIPKGVDARYNPAFKTITHTQCRPLERL